MTLFSASLPIECVLRIWDIYMVEDQKILHRIGLAILKLNQSAILKSEDMAGINETLKDFYEKVDVEQLIKCAISFKVTKAKLN